MEEKEETIEEIKASIKRWEYALLIIFIAFFVVSIYGLSKEDTNKSNKKRKIREEIEEKVETRDFIRPGATCSPAYTKDLDFRYIKYLVEEYPTIFLSDASEGSIGQIKTMSPDAKLKYMDTYNNNYIIEDNDNYFLFDAKKKEYYNLKLDLRNDYYSPLYLSNSSYEELVGFTNKDHKFYAISTCTYLYEGNYYWFTEYGQKIYVVFTKEHDNTIYIGNYNRREIVNKITINDDIYDIRNVKVNFLGDAFYTYLSYDYSSDNNSDNHKTVIMDRNNKPLIEGDSNNQFDYYDYKNTLYIMKDGEYYSFDLNGNKSNTVKYDRLLGILDNYFVLYKDNNFELYQDLWKVATIDTNLNYDGEELDRLITRLNYYSSDVIQFDVANEIYLIDIKDNYKVKKTSIN